MQDIWLDYRDAHNQNIGITGYPTEKNPSLLARIIQASSNPGDLVLDCFSGSGTTLAVASQLDRQWIGIDNSIEAIATTLRRFAKGLEPMGDFVTRESPQAEETSLHKPALWEDADKLNNEESASQTAHVIRDFSLYAAEPDGDEMESVLRQWLEWI